MDFYSSFLPPASPWVLGLFGLFAVCTLVQLGYWLLLFTRVARYRPAPAAERRGHYPGVSVVVAAWNELDNLRELLPLLLTQDYPDFEVIVADDRSTDECYDFLLAQRDAHPRLRLVRINELPPHITPKKFALTLGIKAASKALILVTDADCRPAGEQWIRLMQSHLTEGKELVLGFSPYQAQAGFLNRCIRYETLYAAIQYVSYALAGRAYMGVGRNLLYTRDLFMRHRGFHDHQQVLGGDDDLFVIQAATATNVAVCLDPATWMQSVPKTTFGDWFRQKRRHLSVGKHYPRRLKWRLGLLTGTHAAGWLLLPPLLVFGGLPLAPLAAGLWVVRLLTVSLVINFAQRPLGRTVAWYDVPPLDFLYVPYYLYTGTKALLARRVAWR